MHLDSKKKKILAIGAHTDDIELGCGGLLSIYIEQGYEIKCIVFSKSTESLPLGFPRDTLVKEFERSMEILGTKDYSVEDIPVRYFTEHRQAILEKLVEVKRQFEPDIVLTINSSDTHQDHSVVHNESIRAFRNSSIYGYELPWNFTYVSTNMFVNLEERHLENKINMTLAYESQISLGRPYITYDYVVTAAKFRGYQSRMRFAEAYEVISQRW